MEFLGIDIGGTKCAVVRGNEKGAILERIKFETTTAEETLNNIFSAAEKIKGESLAVGISCGGPLDSEKGIILSPPNLSGWDRVEIVKMVNQRLGLSAYLCNDANACALAEWRFGAGKGSRNMIFLTFGTGMGAGLILDGKLYNGANGNAGEVGHIRLERFGPCGYGKQGSFEGFASGGGIAMLGKMKAIEALQRGEKPLYCNDLSKLDSVTAKSIADAARQGDKLAAEVYNSVGEMLGRGLSILIDILNPEVIVLGSIYQRSSELMKKSMQKVIDAEALRCSTEAAEIKAAELGDALGDKAAIALAVECYKRKADLKCSEN